MSRRNKPQRRELLPDAIYNDVEVARFINRLMRRGKKSIAEKILYSALEQLKGQSDEPILQAFHRVLQKARPLVRVKARRVGGSTYQVPIEVGEYEGIAIVSRWLIANAKKRKGRSMEEKLYQEFLETIKGQSATLKQREDTHRMAEANKAFAHYRF